MVLSSETIFIVGISTITTSIVSIITSLQSSRCIEIQCCCGCINCKRDLKNSEVDTENEIIISDNNKTSDE